MRTYPSSGGTGGRHSVASGLWLRLGVLVIVTGCYLVTVTVNDRKEYRLILEDIERIADVTNISARIHTEAVFQTAIQLLSALRSDLLRSNAAGHTVQEMLDDHFFEAPDLRATLYIDPEGQISASSVRTFIGNDANPRPFFNVHLDPSRDRPFTGDIIVGNVTRQPHFFSSLKLSDSEGNFMGVVAAAYELAYLRDLYRRLVPGPHYTIGLFHAQEGLIVASDSEIRPGELPASSRFPANVPSDGSGHSGAIKILLEDGGDALITTGGVGEGPFFVSTMADVDTLLAAHRRDHLVKIVLAAIFVCTAIGLAVALEIYLHDRRRAEADKAALEANLRHAQKLEALGTLAGGLAHDFNNLLSSIIGFGEIARERAVDRPRLARAIDHILLAGRRAETMVDQILTFSRRSEPVRRPVRLGDVLHEVVDLMGVSLQPSLRISLDLPEDDLWTLGNAGQLDQVFMNLCSNAVQAMPQGGSLAIDARAITIGPGQLAAALGLAPGTYARINVSDTGIGIPAGIRERIFDPFFTTKETGHGTGLGLSIAHGIVSAHGGAMAIDSEPGQGTTVSVFLPLCEAGAESLPEDGGARVDGEGRRVLIVDDEESILSLAEERLAELGFDPVACCSPHAALDLFTATPGEFDLVVTDHAMPEMDGIALTEALRAVRPDLPVILTTGYGSEDVLEHARKCGIDHFLGKPLTARKLAASVARALGDDTTAAPADA